MPTDQRSFFRIDVMLPCSYHIMSAKEAEDTPLPSNLDSNYIEKFFLENLTELDQQINEIIAQIDQKSHLMANALTAINSKVNFVLQTIDEKHLSRTIPQKMVNVSASGLSFNIEEKLEVTDVIDVLIKPLKDGHPILLRCNIINIMQGRDNNNDSTVSLQFQQINEDDKRKLIYFIQQKEIEFAQQKRHDNNIKLKMPM